MYDQFMITVLKHKFIDILLLVLYLLKMTLLLLYLYGNTGYTVFNLRHTVL